MSNEIKYYSVLQDDRFEKNMKKWSGMYMFESVLALGKYVGNLNWCPDGGKVLRKVLAEDWAECQGKSPPALPTVSVKVLLLHW